MTPREIALDFKRRLLIEFAFALNMGLGVMLTGSKLPTQVEKQFDEMIRTGKLVGS